MRVDQAAEQIIDPRGVLVQARAGVPAVHRLLPAEQQLELLDELREEMQHWSANTRPATS